MMAYWAENQGQSPVYVKYCTVPGQNCTHMYHDRHKATYLPLPHCDQREPSCWTLPGSRTGGILHDYTNWAPPDQAAPAASHFPFGLDNPNKDHPHQPQEMRGRERIGGGFRVGPEREYDLGASNKGWQRRWEPGSSSSSLSDSSYRELQAWAARYSHSLPRRRRMDAEIKGAFQDAPESSRTLGRVNRNAPDSNMAALRRTGSSSSARGPWDVGAQQKTMAYNPLPACPPETPMERNNYQRMRFSQPPGYICPPAYEGPHNSSPAMQCHNTFFTDQQVNRKTYDLKSAQPKQNMSIHLQDKRSGNKEVDTKESQKQRSALDSHFHEYQMQAIDPLWQNQPIYSQLSQIQPDSHSSPREVQESKSTEGICSNVIEGRKFKLNKRTGGATIFCLVSRIGGAKSETSKENLETAALPRCTQITNSERSESGGITKGLRDDINNSMTKLADEVDFSGQKLSRIPVEHTTTRWDGDFKAKDTIGLVESQQAADHTVESQTGSSSANQSRLQSTTTDGVGDVNPVVGPQAGQTLPASVRYPLWREPGYTARMDRNISLPYRGLDNNSPARKSTETCGHPIDIEVRRFEIKEDEKPDSCGGQLVIDTTSVLVRMELIPSPKKEHVNYLFHPPYNPPHVDTGGVESIQTQESNPLPADGQAEPQPGLEEGNPADSTSEDILKAEELQSDVASDLCLPCQTASPEKETLASRAERILGIPLFDSNNEQTYEETGTFSDPCAQSQNERETSPPGNNTTDVLCLTEGIQKGMVPQLPDDHANDSVCGQDINITQDVIDTEANEDPEILGEGKSQLSACPHLTEDWESPDVKSLERSVLHDQELETDSQEEENNSPNESNACSSPPSEPSNSQRESPSDLPCPIQHSSVPCESNTETVPPSVFMNDTSESPESQTHTHQEPCSPTSTDSPIPPCEYILFPLPSSPSPEHPSLNLHCLDSSVHEEDSLFVLEVCKEVNNELDDSLQHVNDDITDHTDHTQGLSKDDTQEPDTQGPDPQEPDPQEPDPQLPLTCDKKADCQKDDIVSLMQPTKENTEDHTELEEQAARSEVNTTDFESPTEVHGLQELTITTVPLLDSCRQEQSYRETEGNGDDACPQSVIQHLDPSIGLKQPVDFQSSPCDTDIMPSLGASTFLSDISDCNSEPAVQTDLASLSVPENIDLHDEPFPTGILEISPSDYLESHTSLIVPSPPPSDSSPGFAPLQAEEDTVPLPELPSSTEDTEECQYPRSLWDAVNRIRKHTAPDSENEDEEVSELWDPQNAAEHLASANVETEVDMEPEDTGFHSSEGIETATVSSSDHNSSETDEEHSLDEATLPEDLEEEQVDDVTVALMQQDEHREVGLQDEDRLSCSSITREEEGETAVSNVEEVEKEEGTQNNPDLVMEQGPQRDKLALDEEEKDKCFNKVEDGNSVKDDSLVENDEGGGDGTDTNHCDGLVMSE